MGSPNHSIAIIDTGIDDSHPDVGPFGNLNFSRKIVGWYDATPDMATTPEDYGEHGTHVAGIAAGTGYANSLQASGFVTNTWTYMLSGLFPGQGWIHYGFDVMNPGLITLTCMWTSGNSVFLQLRDATGNTLLNQTSGAAKPLTLTYNATATGRYRPVVGITGGGLGSGYFSLRETYPYEGRADGHNLFTGIAPSSKLVGVKVFDNTGFASSSMVYGGMEWVIANKHIYNITVASMSLSLENGGIDTTFDQKADTMVENGIVTVVSAGNDFPDYTIGSPGTAAYVITVAATNDQNGITSYSSNGDSNKNENGLIKPDVAAPGGSTGAGNFIISADSNDVDYEYSGQSDYTPNDYQQMLGTSMSTPHVSGLAALIIEALSSWNWTKEEVLKVKMIISMTAFEVQSGESTNQPPLNRGDKDDKEGYGRVSADAAIEAVTMNYTVGDIVNETLGSDPSDKKVWARQVALSTGTEYEFRLSVPSGADYDLYIYNGSSDSYGQPVILEKSVNASSGAEETIYYAPAYSGTYYVLVKWVGGSGAFNLTSTVVEHDVTVVSVVPSATEVYAGGTVNVTVVVKNEGTVAETFNVTAYYDEFVIETRMITSLTTNTSTILTFTWNTVEVSPGNYTVSATAGPVLGETDLIDNSFTDGTVEVTIPDLNEDWIVDMLDVHIVVAAFGTVLGMPDWDPRADIAEPWELIDGRDLLVIINSFGQTN
jgi:subtilisin family serine protease